jgi:hypothetical protein
MARPFGVPSATRPRRGLHTGHPAPHADDTPSLARPLRAISALGCVARRSHTGPEDRSLTLALEGAARPRKKQERREHRPRFDALRCLFDAHDIERILGTRMQTPDSATNRQDCRSARRRRRKGSGTGMCRCEERRGPLEGGAATRGRQARCGSGHQVARFCYSNRGHWPVSVKAALLSRAGPPFFWGLFFGRAKKSYPAYGPSTRATRLRKKAPSAGEQNPAQTIACRCPGP